MLTLAAAWCLTLIVAAGTASAQSYPPPTGQPPAVAGQGGTSPDGTAFTGGDPSIPMFIGGSALVLGVTALIVARRRARMLTGTR
jgi:hypothetical protein